MVRRAEPIRELAPSSAAADRAVSTWLGVRVRVRVRVRVKVRGRGRGRGRGKGRVSIRVRQGRVHHE